MRDFATRPDTPVSTAPVPVPVPLTVPVAEIADTRAGFPNARLCFEMELEAQEPWQALALSAAIARTGFALAHVTWRERGCALLRLKDDRNADPATLADLFAAHPGVTLLRWTTQIGGT